MAFFNKRSIPRLKLHDLEVIKSPLPIEHIDVTKRYDVYCSVPGEERLYENLLITAVKTLDDIGQYNRGQSLQIEGATGDRAMISQFQIRAICEHGSQLDYEVLRRWSDPEG